MVWIVFFLYVSFGSFITTAWAVSDVQLYAIPRRPIIYYLYFLFWGPVVLAGLSILLIEFLILKGKQLHAKALHHEPRP